MVPRCLYSYLTQDVALSCSLRSITVLKTEGQNLGKEAQELLE